MIQRNKTEKRNHNWEIAFRKVQEFTIQRGVNSFINPFSLLKLSETDNLVNRIDALYVDGISLVKLINIFIGKPVGR